MYLSHYHLVEKPFQINTDPRYLWLGEKHKEGLATLKYGVTAEKGFLLLTGDVGTGKTTLINALLESLSDDTLVANITDPKLDILSFLNLISTSFNITQKFAKKEDFLVYFNHFLRKAHANNKFVLLIIDEAHTLSKELLEQIRLLSNTELPEKKLLNIFFVGQNELNQTLMSGESRALRQRIALTYQIKPLSESETLQYIRYRLRVAGTERELFNRKAIREIYRFSDGYPRLINIICDHALLTGYARDLTKITPAIIRECSQELRLPGETKENSLSNCAQQSNAEDNRTNGSRQITEWLKRQRLFGALAVSVMVTAALILLTHEDPSSRSEQQKPAVPVLTSSAPSAIETGRTPLAHPEKVATIVPDHPVKVQLPGKSETTKPTALALAKEALKKKHFARAVELFEDAIAQKPADIPNVKVLYAQALRGQADMLVGKDPKKAEILLHKAVEADPQDAKAHFDLGKIYTRSKDYPKAIRAYQKAADLNPHSPETFFNLGFAYAATKDYKSAEEMFSRVTDLKPRYLDKALFNLAGVQQKQGKTQQCIENLEKALMVNPKNQRVRKYLNQFKGTPGE